MSCLPLFSFSPSIPSALKPNNDLPVLRSGEQGPVTSSTIPKSTEMVESLYDKLSRVSVSHRRVDSFEWVMTQSAPNTPPTSLDSNHQPYSPPPTRLVGSAPLPVPNETWSTSSRPFEGRGKRGYFDWWSSPSLVNSKGYARISAVEEEDDTDRPAPTSTGRESVTGSSRSPSPEARMQTSASSPNGGNHLRASQELNALGIVFPCTPPASPPASRTWKSPRPSGSPKVSPRVSATCLPKRVSFSPIVDEVVLETFPDFESSKQPPSYWGSYLPSSFLVARPPLPRTASFPVPRRTIATRPILKRSTSLNHQPSYESTPSTEMIPLSPRTDAEDTVMVASPIPTQRLPVAALRADGHRHMGGDLGEPDRVFVSLLQAAQKPARRRCDSLLSD